MKKFISVAVAAATIVGLAGVSPANAATPNCNGVTATAVVVTGKSSFYIGTAGADVIVVTGAAQSVPTEILAGAGDDMICNQSGNRVIAFGGNGNDNFIGNATSSLFAGGYGDDQASGGAGNEFLYGGPGKDWIVGGAGNDLVAGNAGNDTVFGGAGVDIVVGGAGVDTLSGHGLESKDDKVADKIYGQTSEILLKGTGDITYVLDQAVGTLNASTRNAMKAKYADTKKYMFSLGAQVVDGETFADANILEVMRNSDSSLFDLWLAA
jgi:Ca2+-binding RTX toxin-like protein